MSATHDLRLVPVAAVTWVGAWVGVSGWRPEPQVLLPLTAALVLAMVVAARAGRWWLAVCLLVLTSSSLAAGALSWQRHGSPVAELAAAGRVGTVEFVVRALPHQGARAVAVDADFAEVQARGVRVEGSVPVVLLGSGDRADDLLALRVGARYRAVARLGAAELSDREAAVVSLRAAPEELAGPGSADAWAASLREGLRSAMSHSPPDQAAIVPSLVVGDTRAVGEELREDFRATGLTHLMAVSGANLSLMLGALLAAARVCGVRGWGLRGLAVAGVAAFIVLCGSEPSVLRAAAMGLIALAGIGAGRGRRSLRALCLAVCVLLWLDPWLASSAAFALSVLACAGIVLIGPFLVASLTRWLPAWLAESLAVPIAAQLATQPIVTGISDRVSVVGVLANVLAGPFVGPTTVLGFLAAFLSPLGMPAVPPAWLAGWCAQPILWLAGGGAALPSASWEWPATTSGLLLVALGSAALGCLLVAALRSPWGGAAFAALLVSACLVRPVPLGWPGEWGAVFCDVGQGDATLIRAGPRAAVVIDAGPEPAPALTCLDAAGIDAVPLLVLTHYHADHVGGATEIIARFRPGLVLVRGGAVPAWLNAAAGAVGATVRSTVPGESIVVGDATWTTVSTGQAPPGPGAAEEGEGSAENDASVVAVAESGGLRVVLPGDAEPAGQASALRGAARLGISLSAGVLKLPHHGSARQEPRFFAATGASLAVASAGRDNDYGHPAEAALELSIRLGMTVARTDEQGSVAVALDEARLVVRAARSPRG